MADRFMYAVTAYKMGKRDSHSYIVGIYPKKISALNSASDEEIDRGEKYECEVVELIVGKPQDHYNKLIKTLIGEQNG